MTQFGLLADTCDFPGRLRTPIPHLRRNRALAGLLEERLGRVEGIRMVRASVVTGRLLVLYDPLQVALGGLLRLLRLLTKPPVYRLAASQTAATLEVGVAREKGAGVPDPGVARAKGAATAPAKVIPIGGPLRTGLSTQEALDLLKRHGPNALQSPPAPSFWIRLLEQFKDPMVITLLGGAGISIFAGRIRDALTISAILLLNAVVGASQQGKAEGSLDALRKMAAPQASVLRDGHVVIVPSAQVVPGDLLLLEAGDKVSADAQILEASSLAVDESMLSGESLPVSKCVADPGAPAEGGVGRPDMLFAGTSVTRGRCLARVTATGMRTEMGRIARMLGEGSEGRTPLQNRMDELGRTLVKGSLFVCAGVTLAGLLRGRPLVEMLLTGVSLAVAAIPEGLPTFVTLGLATGVRAMARKQALVRRLQAVETLGGATVICTDKTGTLTTNRMTVRLAYAGGRWYELEGTGYNPKGQIRSEGRAINPSRHPELLQLLRAGALCNNATLGCQPEGWTVVGDSTEGALLVAAAKAGLIALNLQAEQRRTAELPFEADRRRMSVICEGEGGRTIFTKGAPEAVLDACTHLLRKGKRLPLTTAHRTEILAAAASMAGRAYRVLAAGARSLKEGEEPAETGLTFLGLTGMTDPPRPEVSAALARCKRAGVQVIMLTGDHPRAAEAVGREIGLLGPGDLLLTGDEIGRLSDADLTRSIDRVRVCARVSPEQKLRVVRALRVRGHVVAMTGDGVNDAPAVREADIGIAMGINGTEVTKEAAGLVLADDNFATIVAAVEQGRVTYNNIRKAIRYLLASNIGEVVLMGAAVALGLPLPLIPLQILWLNLVGDGLPALALGAEPPDGTEMEQVPRPRSQSLFAEGLGGQIIRHGLQMGAAALGLFIWALRSGKALPVVRTITLCGLVLGQLFYMQRCRRVRRGATKSNPLASWALFGSLALLVGSVIPGPLQRMLQLAPLRWSEWAAAGIAGLAGSYLFTSEGGARRQFHGAVGAATHGGRNGIPGPVLVQAIRTASA